MPVEARQVLFHEDEVKRAIFDFVKETRKPKVRGTLKSFHLEERSGLRALLAVAPDGGDVVTLEIGTAEIAAALILYCRQVKIPLPARAAKKLSLAGHGVRLSLTMDSSGPSS